MENRIENNPEIIVNAINSIKNRECLSCCKKIGSVSTWIKCIRCNILLHHDCEEMHSNRRTYCKCPVCQGIGTLFNTSNIQYE